MDTGMARKIDDLGRIVVPAETRRLFNIKEGDMLSISVDGDNIMLRKLESTVAVGEYSFEVSREAYAAWKSEIAKELDTRSPEKIEAEIKRRLGI